MPKTVGKLLGQLLAHSADTSMTAGLLMRMFPPKYRDLDVALKINKPAGTVALFIGDDAILETPVEAMKPYVRQDPTL